MATLLAARATRRADPIRSDGRTRGDRCPRATREVERCDARGPELGTDCSFHANSALLAGIARKRSSRLHSHSTGITRERIEHYLVGYLRSWVDESCRLNWRQNSLRGCCAVKMDLSFVTPIALSA